MYVCTYVHTYRNYIHTYVLTFTHAITHNRDSLFVEVVAVHDGGCAAVLWDQRTAPLMEANTTDGAPTHTHTHKEVRSDRSHIRTHTYIHICRYRTSLLQVCCSPHQCTQDRHKLALTHHVTLSAVTIQWGHKGVKGRGAYQIGSCRN